MNSPATSSNAPAEQTTALLGDHIESQEDNAAGQGVVGTNEYEGSKLNSPNYDHDFKGLWKKNLVLLLGVFLVNADSAILLAMFRQIASEFGALSSASWIVNSYIVGIIIAQPVCGRLADIYGTKAILIFAYSCYCVGGLIAGVGFSFAGILGGRGIAGVGNALIMSLISTIIVDLVPIQEVAVWRGFVYAVNQIGRAMGPPLGGFVLDAFNWRWALLYQVPLNAIGLIFIWSRMDLPSPRSRSYQDNTKPESAMAGLRRIDMIGATSIAVSNCSLLLFLDQIQKSLDIRQNPLAIITLTTWIAFLVVFIMAEAFWAKEPILPLKLLAQRSVFSSYSIQFLQTAAQVGLYTSVPLFFRLTMDDSSTVMAFRLVIITIGTITGGLLSGFIIKRFGRYRLIIWISLLLSNTSFLVILIRWRGPVTWLETLYGLPCGFGFGVSLSAAFIGLNARLEKSDIAIATSGFYLSLNLGSLCGVSIASVLITEHVERNLPRRLHDRPDGQKIVRDVTADINTIRQLTGEVRQIVVDTYTQGLIHVWYFTLICGSLALLSSLFMREGSIASDKEDRRRDRSYDTFNSTES